ncbi:hypothetical protein MTBLM5_280021 [Magnetospirillum sp. LM-5]|uniref:glycosyltransferase n=1 Tax=Magnetospirillum sp. LM-5 TaxID=2681466 RepID=UPI0013820BEC|nr:glycosyltransferase [Magnetospirillum sp. LM-5]CAA7618763.1 hypothetical protein MTBLM5_280021 [Magnetospirillum sp. LM-5]
MITVVSVVPTALEKDSRSLKIAASLARLGYRSIAVESLPSRQPERLPVAVVPLGGRPADHGRAGSAVSTEGGGGPLVWLRARLPRLVAEIMHLAIMLGGYFVVRPLQGLARAPRGELYYLHEYRMFPLVRLLQILRPAPIIYDAHDFYPEVWRARELSTFWRRCFLPLLSSWEGWVARRADRVVMVGSGVADLFEATYGVRPEILRNAHDSRLERAPARSLREMVGLDDSSLLLVTVGNRKPGQAVDEAIEALNRLPSHVHLAFVGRFYDDAVATARRLGVADRVHAVGPVAPEEVVPFIRSADAALILYWPETGNYRNILPNGFFQSVSANLPLLWPALPELERIIETRQVGRRIDPLDPASIALNVQWLIDNRPAMGHIRQELALLADAVGWEREEQRLGSLVATVLEEWRKGR